MSRRLSSLHRRLPASARPLVEVSTARLGTWSDDNIVSLTTRRGSASTFGGHTPSTAELTVRGEVPASFDDTVTINLTTGATNWLATRFGQTFASLPRRRYTGRVAQLEVNDTGRPTRRTTKLQAGDWASQLDAINPQATVSPSAPEPVRSLSAMMSAARLPVALTPNYAGTLANDWDPLYFPTTASITLTYQRLVGELSEPFGILYRTRRDGRLQAINPNTRRTDGINWRTTVPQPLLRSQCLSPATWEQSSSAPFVLKIKQRRTTNPGLVQTGTYDPEAYFPTTFTRAAGTRDLDLSAYVARSLLQPRAMRATIMRDAGPGYAVPQVTVDLLALILSDRAIDRAQALQLLKLEHGDPIVLAKDWPTHVAGLYYADEIAENLTRTGWQMTLSLSPSTHVYGDPLTDIP